MKTKIVYILVSDENDFYYEFTLVSSYSARLHNPDADILLVVDQETDKNLSEKRTDILKYISKKIVVSCPPLYDTNKECRSRFLKTSLRQHIQGDYLFIDSDTIIADKLDDIDNIDPQTSIACVLDGERPLSEHFCINFIQHYARKMEWIISENDQWQYFNSGVMFVRDNDSTLHFFQEWHNLWKENADKGWTKDQPPMNLTNKKIGYIIERLPPIWNCFITDTTFEVFINAKIIHYFSFMPTNGSPFYFRNTNVFQKIKDRGTIDNEILLRLQNPKSAFIFRETYNPFVASHTFQYFQKHPRRFKYFDKIMKHLT